MKKASGGVEIPVELFHILKDDAVKVLHSYASKFGKLSSSHRTGKGQFSFQSQIGMSNGLGLSDAKECSNYCTIALISHASKVMHRILQARLQQYMNRELQMFKLVLEKAEEPEIKLPASAGSSKKRVPGKYLFLLY